MYTEKGDEHVSYEAALMYMNAPSSKASRTIRNESGNLVMRNGPKISVGASRREYRDGRERGSQQKSMTCGARLNSAQVAIGAYPNAHVRNV